MNRQEFSNKLDQLTTKNKQILNLFLVGKTDEEIRQQLNLVSKDSVRQHMSKIGKIFALNNECGANYRYRDELIGIFSLHQPERLVAARSDCTLSEFDSSDLSVGTIEYPTGAVPLDSPFYIDRVDDLCVRQIEIPGTLLRIKAPKLTGKTSLMLRILDRAQSQNYQTIYLDLRNVDAGSIGDLNKFLKWLCVQVGKQLKLTSRIDEYWEITGAISSCTEYFEEYLLAQDDCQIVLGLDEVDRVFAYPQIAEDFLGMLRSWHDKCQPESIWHKLRLAIAHSTEVDIPFNRNKSPFNVGIPISLPEFTPLQVERLAALHQLADRSNLTERLMHLLGGQPYPIRLAIYHLSQGQISLSQLLEEAPTEGGIYRDRLRYLWDILSQSAELLAAFRQTIESDTPVRLPLDRDYVYQLQSMGLVTVHGDLVVPSCNLYRQYFLSK